MKSTDMRHVTAKNQSFEPAIMALIACLTLPVALHAQASVGPDVKTDLIPEEIKSSADENPPGWHPSLKLSVSLSYNHNSDVIGIQNGTNLNIGGTTNGSLTFLSDDKTHEWLNSLLWQIGYTRTPSIDRLFKSIDMFDLESSYLYHFPDLKWLGPFVTFQLKTSLFPGYTLFADDTQVVRLDKNGDPEQTNAAGEPQSITVSSLEKLTLTDSFAPTTLRESIGFFAIPVQQKIFRLDTRLGFGAWETFVRRGYTVADDADTADFEIRRLENSVQAGPELKLAVSGEFNEYVKYSAKSVFMYPVLISVDTDLEGIDLLNREFEFLLGVQLFEWASLDYTFKAIRNPLIYDGWQIQNGLLVSINFTLLGK